jgi:uncharacterized protein (TIGR02246 family)
MSRHFAFLPIVVALATASALMAAEKHPARAEKQEAEIRQTLATLEESFNRGDAKRLAACWAPDGEFVGPREERIDGRAKIEAAFDSFLASHKNSKLRLGLVSWRLVADDVALVDLVSEMTPVPEGLTAEPTSSAVMVKRDGHWLIGRMHEAFSSLPSHRIHLMKLDWLVGNWVSESPKDSGISVQSTCDWTANGSYLIRKFTVEAKSGVVSGGTEVIGWDPRTHRIRSWTFDSDGGFGESTWTQEGDRWIVRHVGTTPDGGDASATHVVSIADANTLTVQSKDRTVDGVKKPDLPEVKLTRRTAKDEAKVKPAEPPRNVLP